MSYHRHQFPASVFPGYRLGNMWYRQAFVEAFCWEDVPKIQILSATTTAGENNDQKVENIFNGAVTDYFNGVYASKVRSGTVTVNIAAPHVLRRVRLYCLTRVSGDNGLLVQRVQITYGGEIVFDNLDDIWTKADFTVTSQLLDDVGDENRVAYIDIEIQSAIAASEISFYFVGMGGNFSTRFSVLEMELYGYPTP